MNSNRAEVRILIADDHSLFREGLRNLLEELSIFRVVGEAADGQQTLRLAAQLKPDLLLLDLAMPRLSGMEVLRQMEKSEGRLRIIVLAAAIEPEQIKEAFSLGAHAVILKESATALLVNCIEAVLAGKLWVGREAVANSSHILDESQPLLKPESRSNQFGLTKREMEILTAIVAGKTNHELADQFSISEQTVKHHITHIFDKMGVYNRLELALFAIHHGLVRKSQAGE